MSPLAFIAEQAQALDRGEADSLAVLPALCAAGLAGAGVPVAHGGSGGDARDAVRAIAQVAEHSLTAAFMLWGHRCCIEYLLQGRSAAAADRWLPALLRGELAGATGLSNAMKHLAGLEPLQLRAHVHTQAGADTWTLDGQLPWVTNLRPTGFLVAAAVDRRDGGPSTVVVLDSTQPGVHRSADLDLIALRGSHTAAIRVEGAVVRGEAVLCDDAATWLPRVRPAFLGMQCGLSIGLARAALAATQATGASTRPVLAAPLAETTAALNEAEATLLDGLADRRFENHGAPLFRLRIALAGLVQQAVSLELQARGGAAYLSACHGGFARRWAEAAFIPVITPSLTQLQAQLQAHHGG